MKFGRSKSGWVAFDHTTQTWTALATEGASSILDVLALNQEDQAKLLAHAIQGEAAAPDGLPFAPQSLRAFALWESHMLNGARGMVRRFAPPPIRFVANAYEALTGRIFPPLKPRRNYYRHPQFYMSNHRSILPDGAVVPWPAFARVLDFELEIGVVIARPVRDCSPAEGLAAIGGFVVMNDWSARDTQWDDTRHGTFGGIVKAKTFAGAMGPVVVSADEILPRWQDLRGRVRVNGEVWCEGRTAGSLHGLGEMVAYAAWGESLQPGDVLSTGTLPGCCGLELGRFPQPGDTVQLEIDGIGAVTNQLGLKAV